MPGPDQKQKNTILRTPGAENREIQVFQAILAQDRLWHLEKSRARAENGKKTHFFGARGLEMERKVTTLSGMVVRNFLVFYVLPDRTPRGRKLPNTGILGYFCPGRLWHLQKSRARAENGKMKFPSARGTFGAKSGCPKSFSLKVRNFFTFYVLADRTPMGEKSRNTWVLGHFGLGQPLALREIRGRKKNANSHIETERRETNPLQVGPNS